MNKVCAFAPATIANLNVGFDVLGIALSSIGDKVELTRNNVGKHRITEIISDIDLPYEIEKNSCTAVIQAMQEHVGKDVFVDVRLKKGFKAGSGLGSSAASSVAAAFAFNELLGNPYEKAELLPFCTEGERVACGSPILDNVSAALLGGLVMSLERQPIQLPFLQDIYALAYFQEIEIRTEDARAVLPDHYYISNLIEQSAHMAAFMHSIHTNDKALFARSIKDYTVEPYRKQLIPNFDKFRDIAMENGALAFGISGSGPTVFTLVDSKAKAEQIAQEFESQREQKEISTLTVIENLNDNKAGAKRCQYD